MVRRGAYKYIRFGTAFAAFAGYAPLLFDVEADPDELTDLAAALPATAAELDALLTLEVGDPDAIDRAAKAQDQDLFRAYFGDADDAALSAQLAGAYDGFAPADLDKVKAWLAQDPYEGARA